MVSANPPTTTRSWLPRWSSEGRFAPWSLHIYLLPILLVAIWLRFAGIWNEHLYGDEAEYAIVARYLSRDPTYLAYPMIEGMGPTPFVSQPPLILYIMAFSMKIFGATDFAAIFPSLLFGVATVAAVYAIGWRLGGRLPAVAGAALIAVLPFHVELSRRAMLDAGYVFFLVLTTYFLIAWTQDRTRRSAAWAGVAAAGAALSKLPGVLVVAAALVVFLLVLAITLARAARGRAREGAVRETLVQGGFGAMPVAIGAFLYLGLLYYLEAIGNLWVKLQWQLGRVDTDQAVATEATAVVRDASFYLSDPEFGFAALLGGLVFALALVGAAVLVARFAIQRGRKVDVLVVPLVTLILASFFFWSDRKEGFYLLPFAPLAAVLVAQAARGIRDLVRWGGIRVSGEATARTAPIALAVGILLVAVPAYSAAAESYEDFALGDRQEKYFGYGTKEAALWIHEHDPEAGQYGTLLGRFTLLWYNEQPTYHWYVGQTHVENMVESGELRYIVYDKYLQLPHDDALMTGLINKYNGQKVAEWRDGPGGWAWVQVYELHP